MGSVLPPVADKPRYVADMFERIAARYDLMNTLMTFGQDARWRSVVADMLLDGPHPDRPLILDVGTGTGRLAQTVRQTLPGARVVGVDFSQGMLRRAPRHLALAAGDALRLPFADAQFDAVISGFVVRNLGDVNAGVAEQVRVLRPGGLLVILETTPGPRGAIRFAYRLYFRRAVPWLGTLIAGDALAYTYLPESTLAFLEPARLAHLMRERGLRDVRTSRLSLGSVAVTRGRKPAMLAVAGGDS
ncbi:MAG TPA: ubiquinone/menaquinone biosynthesis methyltransferase [Chloroflexota bacterium]